MTIALVPSCCCPISCDDGTADACFLGKCWAIQIPGALNSTCTCCGVTGGSWTSGVIYSPSGCSYGAGVTNGVSEGNINNRFYHITATDTPCCGRPATQSLSFRIGAGVILGVGSALVSVQLGVSRDFFISTQNVWEWRLDFADGAQAVNSLCQGATVGLPYDSESITGGAVCARPSGGAKLGLSSCPP